MNDKWLAWMVGLSLAAIIGFCGGVWAAGQVLL